ncbi:hypothetical protein BU25DRAFT_357993, partial [Macroventuria anomochaeta]
WQFGPSAPLICEFVELLFISDVEELILPQASRLRPGSLQCWSCCRWFRQRRQTSLWQYPPVYSPP